MQQVLAWFRRLDSVIVEQTTVLRVMDHGPETVTLSVEDRSGQAVREVSIGFEWVPVAHGLEVRYDGQWPDERSPTHTRPGIEFRDLALVDLRHHSFAGVPVGGDTPWGRS